MTSRNIAVFLALAGATFVQFGLIRPWYRNWGATRAEIHRSWPGDDFTPKAAATATRAIAIHASAEQIWPWIMQIGQDRAGFYSYTVLENLFFAGMRNADRIVPEYQSRHLGDSLWLASKDRFGGKARMVIGDLIPNRGMVLIPFEDLDSFVQTGIAPSGAWSFFLEPVDAHTTRFVMRSRSARDSNVLARVLDLCLLEPAHFIMERKMMLGVRERAEGTLESGPADTVQVLFWFAAFLVVVGAGWWSARVQEWRRPLIAALLAYAVLIFLAYRQPSLLAGGILLAVALGSLFWARHREAPRQIPCTSF